MVGYIRHHGNPQGISLANLIREDYATNGRDWSAPGFRALAVHRLGNWRIPVYDGSWAEWGSREDLPLATGA